MSNQGTLKEFEQNVFEVSEAFHLHACRSGPLNANEIYLALCENAVRPKLQLIRGIAPPKGIVAKYLKYWASGLPNALTEFLAHQLVLSGEHIFFNGSWNQKIICSPSDEVSVSKRNLIESLVLPADNYYRESLRDLGLPALNIKKISHALDKHRDLNLKTGLRDISQIIVNTLLVTRNLPIYEIEDLTEEEICRFNSVNSVLFNEAYLHLLEKIQGRYQSAAGTIRGELRSYNGRKPNEMQINKILNRSHHKNPCLNGLDLSEETVLEMMKRPEWVPQPSLSDILEVAIKAYKRSITKSCCERMVYMNGKEMVRAIFKVASKKNIAVIIQEFERDDAYEVYKQNIVDFPKLTILSPVCRTWDVEKFPEFDKNALVALKYLSFG
jgi:hypothetical protein